MQYSIYMFIHTLDQYPPPIKKVCLHKLYIQIWLIFIYAKFPLFLMKISMFNPLGLVVVVVVMDPHHWGASRALVDDSIAARAYAIARAGLSVKIPSSKAVSPKTRCLMCDFAGQ